MDTMHPARIMLDLETLGKIPGSVIVAIGAVHFGEGQIHSEFYTLIDIQSSLDAGLKVDGSTIQWWLAQPDAARIELTKQGVPLCDALEQFATWLRGFEGPVEIWGNGPSFDCSVLAVAYDALKMSRPWKYSAERCYRTVRALSLPLSSVERTTTAHNALSDARFQSMVLMGMLQSLEK